MRGLRAIRWRSGDTRASCHDAATRTAAPYREAKPYGDATHTSFRRANRLADGQAKPGPNRQPGCDSLRRAARQNYS